MMLLLSRWLGTKPRTLAGARRDSGNEGCGHPQDVDHCAECGSSNHHSGRMRATSECAQNLGSRMRTPGRLSIVRKAAPVFTNATTGIGVAVLVLAASSTGIGPQWIAEPRPLDLPA